MIMTFMTARQAWSRPVVPSVRPFIIGRYAADPRMVAGRPAPPGR